MRSDIQVYGADWCGLTHCVRKYLTRGRFDYEYLDIEHDPDARAFVLAACDGQRRLPVVVVEGCVVTNPSVSELQRVLDEYQVRPQSKR